MRRRDLLLAHTLHITMKLPTDHNRWLWLALLSIGLESVLRVFISATMVVIVVDRVTESRSLAGIVNACNRKWACLVPAVLLEWYVVLRCDVWLRVLGILDKLKIIALVLAHCSSIRVERGQVHSRVTRRHQLSLLLVLMVRYWWVVVTATVSMSFVAAAHIKEVSAVIDVREGHIQRVSKPVRLSRVAKSLYLLRAADKPQRQLVLSVDASWAHAWLLSRWVGCPWIILSRAAGVDAVRGRHRATSGVFWIGHVVLLHNEALPTWQLLLALWLFDGW